MLRPNGGAKGGSSNSFDDDRDPLLPPQQPPPRSPSYPSSSPPTNTTPYARLGSAPPLPSISIHSPAAPGANFANPPLPQPYPGGGLPAIGGLAAIHDLDPYVADHQRRWGLPPLDATPPPSPTPSTASAAAAAAPPLRKKRPSRNRKAASNLSNSSSTASSVAPGAAAAAASYAALSTAAAPPGGASGRPFAVRKVAEIFLVIGALALGFVALLGASWFLYAYTD
ncbi:hypothetical protein HK405_014300, partial [Cladochytrium tenue]